MTVNLSTTMNIMNKQLTKFLISTPGNSLRGREALDYYQYLKFYGHKKTLTPTISFLLSLLLLEKDELDWFTATFRENILQCTFTKEMNLHFPTHKFARANKRHTTYPNLRHLLKLRHCLSVQIEMLQHLVPLMGPMPRTRQPSSGQPVHGQISIP